MNRFCISFFIYNFLDGKTNKIKIQYFMVPVSLLEEMKYKSMVSEKKFSYLKKIKLDGKKVPCKIDNGKDFSINLIVETDKCFEDAEVYYLPKVNKLVQRRLFFKPKFKKALQERIKQILR